MVSSREMEEEEDDEEEKLMLKSPKEEVEQVSGTIGGKDTDTTTAPCRRRVIVELVARRLSSGDLRAKIQAARDVRSMVRKSSSSSSKSAVRSLFAAAGVIEPLVSMLHDSSSGEAALLALLNLAARDQRNKIRIVSAGAIAPLVELLRYQDSNLRELAAAAILSLSSADSNNPTIATSGAVPLLVQILCAGSVQGRVDAVTTLYNLSNHDHEPKLVLDSKAVAPLINLLKECKKYSKFAEKTTFLLEIFSDTEEGRNAITNVNGGILTLVETVEDGSPVSMSHAVGALLSLCKSSLDKYRDLILNEGAIPGLLRLTAEGTPIAQDRARTLLDLLRNSPVENRLSSFELEKIVYDFATNIDKTDKAVETAKRLLQDVVQKSIDLSLSRRKVGA